MAPTAVVASFVRRDSLLRPTDANYRWGFSSITGSTRRWRRTGQFCVGTDTRRSSIELVQVVKLSNMQYP